MIFIYISYCLTGITRGKKLVVLLGTKKALGMAVALATSQTISLSGDVTGSGSFDGSGNVNIYTGASAALKVSMIECFSFGHFA